MRLWSIHPKYLDSKGMVALWRETLLAKHVLAGRTKGYTNHPQLDRFKTSTDPIKYINKYLEHVFTESIERVFSFDKSKFEKFNIRKTIAVHDKQIQFEWEHLLKKLYVRDRKRFNSFKNIKSIAPHPLFHIIPGEIESWERV